jgi:hypothetical protein
MWKLPRNWSGVRFSWASFDVLLLIEVFGLESGFGTGMGDGFEVRVGVKIGFGFDISILCWFRL